VGTVPTVLRRSSADSGGRATTAEPSPLSCGPPTVLRRLRKPRKTIGTVPTVWEPSPLSCPE